MSPRKRQRILVGIMLAMLAVAALWSLSYLFEQRADAERAAGELSACRVLARRMTALRDKPAVASAKDVGVRELGTRIDAASAKARLGRQALRSVDPGSPRAMDDTPYLLKPTTLELQGVTLPQLTSFLYHLTSEPGLVVRDLRIRNPRRDSEGADWNAEATLTWLIYSPQRAKELNR
ncbi:MAG: hypothetical protein ACOCZU_06160 [Planctomycetota bacterium]